MVAISFWRLLAILIMAVVFETAINVFLLFIPYFHTHLYYAALLTNFVSSPIVIYMIGRYLKVDFAELLFRNKIPIKAVWVLPLAICCRFFVHMVNEIPMMPSLPDLFPRQSEMNIGISFAGAVIIAPVFEELFFRGILLPVFLKKYGHTSAILISAVVFSLWHQNPAQLFPTFIYGIALGWVFYQFSSIYLAIAMHMIINAIGILGRNEMLPDAVEKLFVSDISPMAVFLALLVAVVSIHQMRMKTHQDASRTDTISV